VENDPTFHSDIDKNLFDKLPLESASSSLSSLVTLTTPGIAADSNGLFHGLGDHAENSFSVDGQPITDQQSKVFSNQIPLESVQSMEVISGAPPAEYGGKTSVVIVATTRSGLRKIVGARNMVSKAAVPEIPLGIPRATPFSVFLPGRSIPPPQRNSITACSPLKPK